MHRAQKASSKLGQDREVEKAQELHHRKIDGVKSQLTAATRLPAPAVPSTKPNRQSTFFRRSLRQHVPETKPTPAAHHHSHDEGSALNGDAGNAYSQDQSSGGDDGDGDHMATNSFGKLDELRSVLVPVMAYKDTTTHSGGLDYERYLNEITHPPAPDNLLPKPQSLSHRHQSSHSLRTTACRMRRLKQIEADNASLVGRIQNTTAHYRTEQFKNEWGQNVAYLTSICEFPVADATIHTPPPRRQLHLHPERKRSPFARPLEQLPSLQFGSPPTVHPIKATATSTRKVVDPLNLSPAFRSLRKGLPQMPALPPLAASPRTTGAMKIKSVTAVASSRAVLLFDEQSSPRPSPTNAEPNSAPTVPNDPARYMLLKIGRFVGGKYLILTVFCGHGITNPYGFDVVALDPETRVEFHLAITKETTHRLLETSSSSSMAERTAAAAGTNLSMEVIAQCICDHVRYASMGDSQVVFLIATAGDPGGRSEDASSGQDQQLLASSQTQMSASDKARLLVEAPHAALAVCFHRRVQITSLSKGSDEFASRVVDVFASTRPPQCCRASMQGESLGGGGDQSTATRIGEFSGLVCYELFGADHDDFSSSRRAIAQAQVTVNDLFYRLEAARVVVDSESLARLSLDRLIGLSLEYLHLTMPADGEDELQLSLAVGCVNDWSCPTGSPCRPQSMVLPRLLDTRPPQRKTVPSTTDRCSSSRITNKVKNVLQTGMLWRGAFLIARVALLCPGTIDDATGETIHDPLDELLVINVLNTSTATYSERVLHGDRVEQFSQKLGAWQAAVGATPPLLAFAKLLLLRMRLDLDLRGHEVIVFPTLEPKFSNDGGHSSPVASSRRQHSPARHTVSTAALAVSPAEMATQIHWIDAESDQQHVEAAVRLQAVGRGFLQRLHQQQQRSSVKLEQIPEGSSHRSSLLLQALPVLVLVYMKKRAAKHIQQACRAYVDRAKRRKKAHVDLSGGSFKLPRALTPTTAATRSGTAVATAADLVLADAVDQVGLSKREGDDHDDDYGDDDGDDDDDKDDDDDDGGDGRTRRVDLLGALEENPQEDDAGEDTEDATDATTRTAGLSFTSSSQDSHQPKPPITASAATASTVQVASSRSGRKLHGQFALERHHLDRVDMQILGPGGYLQNNC